ncbi:alpha/beta fold hydrolase [Vibrio nitrifigilis]|uniref:Alpha/beta fold hydrolase n=1 Tax=Vibrio nitrifigilis TaxID=2789781 RepID=A0ABS0GEE2_9VIBR|nr:alpha/beta hydrolase [Vibrio nitrifigilis]MBF9000771.1 alpha/beta fold hydrolase [Vibrio nitrifigilis]
MAYLLMLFHKVYSHPTSQQWVVFIHGAGGSSSLWFKQIKEYRQHFNLLLVDLRGHGKSNRGPKEWLLKPYQFADVAQDVIHVIDHLSIEKAHFVAMSLGTIIVRTIAQLVPERVESMVMGGAVMQFNLRSRILVKIGDWCKNIVPYMWLYQLFAHVVMPDKHQKESRHLFIREAKKLCQKEFKRWYRLTAEAHALMGHFRETELPIPTLYLMGERDHLFLPAIRKMLSTHRCSQLIELSNCGHVCNIEQSEAFNHHSIRFLLHQ